MRLKQFVRSEREKLIWVLFLMLVVIVSGWIALNKSVKPAANSHQVICADGFEYLYFSLFEEITPRFGQDGKPRKCEKEKDK